MNREHSLVLPLVGVMGSGTEPHADRASAVGTLLASLHVHLVTGGGGGVMAQVCKAFCSIRGRRGRSIGIIPGNRNGIPLHGYPNPWVEIPVYTHLPLSGRQGTDPLSRNHINILSSQVIIALPGSHGTASEVLLAHTYGRPVIAFVDSPKQIPGIAEDIPLARHIEQVKNFVLSHINQSGSGG